MMTAFAHTTNSLVAFIGASWPVLCLHSTARWPLTGDGTPPTSSSSGECETWQISNFLIRPKKLLPTQKREGKESVASQVVNS